MEKYRLQNELSQVAVQTTTSARDSFSGSSTSYGSLSESKASSSLSHGLTTNVSPRSLTDDQLIERLRGHILEERRVVTLILEYLREVDRRRLYAEAGYPSLWDFCIRELGYSEGAASRRINSMRLLRDLPELKKDIEEGKHNLSSLAQAQKFFRTEEKHHSQKMSPEKKKEVLQKLENKTSLECEKELIQLSSVPLQISRPQTERLLDEKHVELKLVVSQKLLLKLKRVQALRSHASPSMNYAELLEFMADEVLRRFDPVEKEKAKSAAANSKKGNLSGAEASGADGMKSEVLKSELPPPEVSRPNVAKSVEASVPKFGGLKTDKGVVGGVVPSERTPIPEGVRRSVWLRDGGKCGHRDPKTGRVCGSQHYLEIDHIRPVSRGAGMIRRI